jgi:SEC-C motif-containing protein
MRSRYSAFVLCDKKYLQDSWHPDFCPDVIEPCEENVKWLGLSIKRIENGGEHDQNGVVEYVARYKIAGKGFRLHEVSQFARHKGKWVYTTGHISEK